MPRVGSIAPVLLSLAAVFGAVFMVDVGQGLLNSLVPLRLRDLGFGVHAAGMVGSLYAAGFIVGVLFGARVVRAVGHVRAFGGCLSLMVVFALLLPLLPHVGAWATLRFLHGAAIASVCMVIETWLTSVAPYDWRGRVLALYTALSYAGFGAGQLLLPVYPIGGLEPFALAAVLLGASFVPVAFSRRIRAPVMIGTHATPFGDLLALSPLALIGSLSSGLVIAALLSLGPFFAAGAGLAISDVALFMGTLMVGGIVLEWPIGLLSDRVDRRRVMFGLGVGTAAAAAAVAWLVDVHLAATLAAVALLGGACFALYPVALAQAADHLEDGADMTPVATGLLIAYGVGAVVGPLAAGILVQAAGGRGLFVFTASVGGMLAACALWRSLARPGRVAHPARYVAIPEAETTPAVFELDPRVEPRQLQFNFEPRAG